MQNIIKLTGCAPTPLANYLKALGILRLVSEQADATARGAWRDEAFVLHTKLTPEELRAFFLEKYAPSPLISPWNGGSGFLKDDKRVAPLLRLFEHSKLGRLASYKAGAQAARRLCEAMASAKQEEVAIKNETNAIRDKAAKEALRNSPEYKARLNAVKSKLKRLKEQFIPECRLQWRGTALEWLEAALIIKSDLSAAFPALLGSGGNDGALDFTANFRERFADLFDLDSGHAKAGTAALLDAAFFATPVLGAGSYNIGQFMPGAAGGVNSSSGLDGKAYVNPWDFILFMEGTLPFAATATRRLNQAVAGSAPFALYAQSAGHISASATEKTARGEQWMPLWEQPALLGEVRALLAEGRAQLGRAATRDPLEMARAVARLGVARGITAFERYGYIERNGQSTFAVPLGRWQVTAQPRQELLSDLDRYLARLRREARGKHASNTLIVAARNLDNAIFAVTANGALPRAWQNVLLALATVEQLLAPRPVDKNRVGLLTGLSSGWIQAANDGTPEYRLALALGTQIGIRRHFLPLNKFGGLDAKGSTSVVCFGRDLLADSIAFFDRRLVESSQQNIRELSQYAPLGAALADIDAFLQGTLDEARILDLARAFMALKSDAPRGQFIPQPPSSGAIEDGYTLFRLAFAPTYWQLKVPPRAAIFRRLASGDITTAARAAATHLRAHGIVAPIALVAGDARRLAASLAFPISHDSSEALLKQFTISQKP